MEARHGWLGSFGVGWANAEGGGDCHEVSVGHHHCGHQVGDQYPGEGHNSRIQVLNSHAGAYSDREWIRAVICFHRD